jgi:ArsR family transcriptional regulator, arsenate/arsenite/antimonite-responsive transcriptional repressor
MCSWLYLSRRICKVLFMGRRGTFDLARLFAALADPTRLRLLNLMRGREVCVCYFVEILQQGQPKISRHLAYLRNAGVVRARREGKWMHYRIEMPDDEGAAAILTEVLRALERDPQMRADEARLSRACCQPAKFVALEGAPVPLEVSASR